MTPLHERRALPLLNLLLSGATAAVLTFEVPAALHAPVLIAFVLICLGLSALQFLSFGDLAADLTFMFATGLALLTLLTAPMLYLVGWSPQTAVLSLSFLCMGLALVRLWQERRRRRC